MSKPTPQAVKRPYIGGQAVIEGVMMRSPRSFAIVVRRKAGTLQVRERKMIDIRKGWLAWPMVRGVVTLVESLRLGTQALRFSTECYEQDLEAEERAAAKAAKGPGVINTLLLGALALMTADAEPSSEEAPPARSHGAVTGIAMLAAVLVFVALPQGIAAVCARLFHLQLDIRSPGFQALTGVFKLIIVIGYMLLIRRIPEIRRVFEFHGAEHKAIATYEAGEALEVENARAKPRLHPRCGTTFLVMVVFVSILVFTAIGPLLPHLPVGGKLLENVLFFVMKLPFLPVIAAITYELQRISARFCLTGPLRAFLYPGFAVQMITTIEPDDTQLEVALSSLKATLWREHADAPSEHPASPPDRTFASFPELMAEPAYGSVPATEQHAAS